MSHQSTKSTQKSDANRRLSASSSERIVFYMNDTSLETSHDPSPDICERSGNCYTLYASEDRSCLYTQSPDLIEFQLDNRSALHLSSPEDEARRCVSGRTKTESLKQARKNSELDQRSSRRSSVQSSRSRTNSCSRPTPLGNGRRGSTSRRTKSRRASAARRKDSVGPVKSGVNETPKLAEDTQDSEQARRHRRIAMIVLGTFLFLLAASVLVVVITLTHSTFLSPPTGSQELAEHRARLRRENEELLNSLNRDYTAENSTVSS